MQRKNTRLGWQPDLPDHRDQHYEASRSRIRRLPARLDLRPLCPPVLDQGNLGSSSACAVANLLYFRQLAAQDGNAAPPSRLFLYYNARELAGNTAFDAGASLRDTIKSAIRLGVCQESKWPYEPARYAKKPVSGAYLAAIKPTIASYQRIPANVGQLRSAIANGHPILIGFTAYQSLESPGVARDGVIPMPSPLESPIGGHALLAVGYDDILEAFIVMNSWGEKWGHHGYGTLPYAYLTTPGLGGDYWRVGE